MRSSTLAALGLLLCVAGCGGDSDPAAPPTPGSIQLTANVLSASVVQGSTTTVVLTLDRQFGYAGAVTLSAEGLPANVTVTFAPATLSGAVPTSTATISAGATAALGAATVTLRATGAGVTARTVLFELTVLTPPLAVVVPASPPFVSRGSSATTVIRVVRTNFTAPFTLTAEDVPAGITASFSPATVSDSSALLTITAAGGATLGASALTVRANGGGDANAAASIPFTVGAAGAGASVVWRFCSANDTPVWFAFRDGAAGTWTRVQQGANRSFAFALTGGVGAVSYVVTANGYPHSTVHYASAAELVALGTRACYVAPATKTLTFPFAGLGVDQGATVRLGVFTGGDLLGGQTSLTADNVTTGLVDLLATRYVPAPGGSGSYPDRYILRPGVNYAGGSTIPTLDFAGGEAFDAVAATVTLTNVDDVVAYPYHYVVSANGRLSAPLDRPPSGPIAGLSFVKYGLPATRMQPGYYHQLDARGSNLAGDDYRTIERYDLAHVDRTLAFGPALDRPTLSTLGTAPYARVRAAGTWQSAYEGEIVMSYTQSGGLLVWEVTQTRAFDPVGTAFAIDVPDLSAIAGFDNAWGLVAGAQTNVGAIGRGPALPALFDGAIFRAASRGMPVLVP